MRCGGIETAYNAVATERVNESHFFCMVALELSLRVTSHGFYGAAAQAVSVLILRHYVIRWGPV